MILRQFNSVGCSWPKSILTALKQGFIKSEPEELEDIFEIEATEKMAPRFGDLFRHINFDQRICCNAYMKTMVKNEQPCSSRIFLAALVQIL